ncbi:DUF6284 family protein [Luedemannella flava]
MITNQTLDDDGPTSADLAAIEREWPLIEAEMDLVAAEITVLCSDRPLTEMDWRRLRRAEQRVSREFVALYGTGAEVERWAA